MRSAKTTVKTVTLPFIRSIFQAMKARHWERIETLTEHTFDVDSDNFFLRNIMEAPILPNKDDIEVIILCLYTIIIAVSKSSISYTGCPTKKFIF